MGIVLKSALLPKRWIVKNAYDLFVVLSGTFKLFWKRSIKMNNPVYKKNKAFQVIKLLLRQKESAAKHVLLDKG